MTSEVTIKHLRLLKVIILIKFNVKIMRCKYLNKKKKFCPSQNSLIPSSLHYNFNRIVYSYIKELFAFFINLDVLVKEVVEAMGS